MAIDSRGGRPHSVITDEERLGGILEDWDALSRDEQSTLLAIMRELEHGDFTGFEELVEVEYEHTPVDPLTFLRDDYYLGAVGNDMWPILQEDFVELFEGGYSEAILGGSLGWGKTFFATCALCYVIYQMTCLKEPQKVYGLAPGSQLAIALLSVTREAARRVPLNDVYTKISLSPYFKERVPYKFAQTMFELRFPSKRIMAIAGSTATAAIGTNVFSGFIDEVSFMGVQKVLSLDARAAPLEKGEIVYKAITRRMKSRFQRVGKLPGIFFLVSSKERPVAFVEKRISEARDTNDPSTFIREYATWDVKPREEFSGKVFQVLVGDERVRSKLDPSPEEVEAAQEEGIAVIEVPVDYRKDFEDDLEGSIRDIAGVATETISPYIHRREAIYQAFSDRVMSPVDLDEWVEGEMLEFFWDRVAEPYVDRLPGGFEEEKWRPLRHPNAVRYVHIDPALTGDSAGLAIGHVSTWTEVVRKDHQGKEHVEIAPVIEGDLLLAIVPPSGGEIILGDIRAIVYQFMEHGFQMAFCSSDTYQHADTFQQFRARGIECDVLSVDKTMVPYDLTKTAMYEGRLVLPINQVAIRELRELQKVPKPRSKGFKVDHPAKSSDGRKGSKDVADGLAGMVYSLTQRTPGRPMPPVTSTSTAQAAAEDHSWVTDGRVIVQGQQGRARGRSSPRAGEVTMPWTRG